jgi:sec-independent protein translocase protein TatB
VFDVAFSELVVIAIVALIVIGPEKLPKVARTLGLLLGRMQRYVATVKADIDSEMRLEDLRKLQQDVQQKMTQTQAEIDSETRHSEQSIADAAKPDLPPEAKQ